MQRPGVQQTPRKYTSPYNYLTRLHVKEKRGWTDLRGQPFIAIDEKNTRRHDDAISVQDTNHPEWKRVHIAISAVGKYSTFDYRYWPDEYHFRLNFSKKSFSLEKKNQEALVLSYYSDGAHIEQPEIQMGIVDARATTSKDLDSRVQEQLQKATGYDSIGGAINHCMLTHNTLFANWAQQRAIPIMHYNQVDERRFYSLEPAGHEELGLDHYSRSSSPLTRMEDRLSTSQGIRDLLNLGGLVPARLVEEYCEHQTRKLAKEYGSAA